MSLKKKLALTMYIATHLKAQVHIIIGSLGCETAIIGGAMIIKLLLFFATRNYARFLFFFEYVQRLTVVCKIQFCSNIQSAKAVIFFLRPSAVFPFSTAIVKLFFFNMANQNKCCIW